MRWTIRLVLGVFLLTGLCLAFKGADAVEYSFNGFRPLTGEETSALVGQQPCGTRCSFTTNVCPTICSTTAMTPTRIRR